MASCEWLAAFQKEAKPMDEKNQFFARY